MLAERKAARSDALRGELLDIVAQWLDLAHQAERLAKNASSGDFHETTRRLQDRPEGQEAGPRHHPRRRGPHS